MWSPAVIILTLFIFYFARIKASSPCIKSGTTWSSDGQIAFFPEIQSDSTCIEICIAEENCNGYTWHGKFSTRISNVCVLFHALKDEYDCIDCISGNLQR